MEGRTTVLLKSSTTSAGAPPGARRSCLCRGPGVLGTQHAAVAGYQPSWPVEGPENAPFGLEAPVSPRVRNVAPMLPQTCSSPRSVEECGPPAHVAESQLGVVGRDRRARVRNRLLR